MRERRLLMISNGVMPDQLGGLQRYVRELAGALAARELDVTVAVRRANAELPPVELADDGVRLVRFDIADRSHPLYAALYPLGSLRAVAGRIRAHGAMVHVHYPAQGLGAAVQGRPYVHTFHAPVYRELLAEHQDRYALPGPVRSGAVRAVRALEGAVAARAAATLVLSDFMRDELQAVSRRAAARAVRVPGGFDARRFTPGPGIEHPFTARRPLVFTARRLVPRTGVLELIEAAPRVLAAVGEAGIAIAGDGPLRAQAQQLIDSLGIRDRVCLLGRVSDAELLGWYRAADLFVMPTKELEGFGMATVEALSCGTPAVGTPAGATPEILAPLDPRLVAADASPAAIAAVIIDALQDPARLAALAARARPHVTGALSWDAVADAHLELYERTYG